MDSIGTKAPAKPRRQLSLRTNLISNALLIPNVGVEMYLNDGFSILGSWGYAWWSRRHTHQYWRIYGGVAELRRYLDRNIEQKSFNGHHIGLIVQGFTYDIANGKEGQLSHFQYGIASGYGYKLPLTQKIDIDVSIGLGYLGGRYMEYGTPKPGHSCYPWERTLARYYFGPTYLGISLVWHLSYSDFDH